ncbi:hypothetical protein [Paractinoplanes rishiriensis]|uniref:Uncharacterized protein n=1 Tax=Paractinoplanes rishiriensis TaxID=1050105 RepID=A0A919KBS6_9ACTN|nr:hypothetical protein [Actinoplanes rishiriensis]GIF02349.1 hypothetical protein Ari01nite_98130 [Actinoplanes rishiriensis]
MLRRRDPVVARMLTAIAAETVPYTDPRAGYPFALAHRAQRQPDQAGYPADGPDFAQTPPTAADDAADEF